MATDNSRVVGRPFLERLRRGVGYGCKYASKDWSSEVLDGGAHRYEVAQGFQPRQVIAEAATLDEALCAARALFDGRPEDVRWASSTVKDWQGPPCWCLTWWETEPL